MEIWEVTAMNKKELQQAVRLLTRAQGIIDKEIWDSSGDERDELEQLNGMIDNVIVELEYYMA